MLRRALPLSTLLLAWAVAAPAQLISIRTVPISQDHQFDIFPSYTMAMGGVSIAVRDSLLDPFTNPATGSRLGATRFFSSPAAFSVSSQAGGGRTLPLGALMRGGAWYGGLTLALQEVDLSRRVTFPPILPVCRDSPAVGHACIPPSAGIDLSQDDRSHGNAYAFAMLGRELPAGLSLGGSLFWSQLHAVDGVDLLYPGNARIDQHGHAVDLRVGALKEWSGGSSLEAMVLHNRFGTTHDVVYLDSFWDPGTQQFLQRPRLEENLDRTNTWGIHLAYERPLPATGWTVGGIATTNLASHPKIPNYEIQNIPRDPGHSAAFDVGVGVSRTNQGSTVGLDLVYEPIWSHTWADAEAPVETVTGDIIPAGGRTIENDFRFSNALLRMGLAQDLEFDRATKAVTLQLGVAVRVNHYWLTQRDNVLATVRDQEERWVEWTPTWGVGFRFPALAIGYRGRVTNGTGRPGVVDNRLVGVADAPAAGSIIVAPSGPLTLTGVKVVTHQFSLSLPLR